jgi:hypothetical protein
VRDPSADAARRFRRVGEIRAALGPQAVARLNVRAVGLASASDRDLEMGD